MAKKPEVCSDTALPEPKKVSRQAPQGAAAACAMPIRCCRTCPVACLDDVLSRSGQWPGIQ